MNGLWGCAVVLLLVSGCSGDPSNHPLLVKGDRYRREGDFEQAEKFYLRFVERHPTLALGHRVLANLYDESLNNPVAALYHYDRFLRLEPKSSDRELIAGYRKLVRARLLRDLQREEQPVLLADESAQLRRENQDLRMRLERYKRMLLVQQQTIERLKRATPAGDSANEYVVQSGDTPGRIAVKFYGSATNYRMIMEANGLDPDSKLRVGQLLKIPALNK